MYGVIWFVFIVWSVITWWGWSVLKQKGLSWEENYTWGCSDVVLFLMVLQYRSGSRWRNFVEDFLLNRDLVKALLYDILGMFWDILTSDDCSLNFLEPDFYLINTGPFTFAWLEDPDRKRRLSYEWWKRKLYETSRGLCRL